MNKNNNAKPSFIQVFVNLNLALRFLLEIAALISLGIWGWDQSENWPRFIYAIGIPFLAAIIWGIFNVPNDPSRSGKAPIPIPGFIRLIIELTIFGIAVWSLFDIDKRSLAVIVGSLVLFHYLFSPGRIKWLLKQNPKIKG